MNRLPIAESLREGLDRLECRDPFGSIEPGYSILAHVVLYKRKGEKQSPYLACRQLYAQGVKHGRHARAKCDSRWIGLFESDLRIGSKHQICRARKGLLGIFPNNRAE